MRLVPFLDVLVIIIFVLIATLLLWLLLFRITNNNHKSALIVSIFFTLFFSFGQIFPAGVSILLKFGIDIRSLVFNQIGWKLWLFSLFWVGIFLLFIFLILKIKSDLRLVSIFMNAASVVLLSFSLFLSIQNFLRQEKRIKDIALYSNNLSEDLVSEPIKPLISIPQTKPNIYYIILDGYAREDILKNYYEFDNKDLIDYLTRNNFYIASQSYANYAHTIHSLA
ncbi:MAG: hypothetical protein ACW99Q_30045, partial [Candidatus Kariarchaeaceae archaeon]